MIKSVWKEGQELIIEKLCFSNAKNICALLRIAWYVHDPHPPPSQLKFLDNKSLGCDTSIQRSFYEQRSHVTQSDHLPQNGKLVFRINFNKKNTS